MEMQQFQLSPKRPLSAPAKLALLVFGIVLFLPIFALILIAGVIATFVFGVLFVFSVCSRKIRLITSRKDSDGRKNVRVKR